MIYSAMVTSPNEKELILIGGYGTDQRNALIEWNGDPNIAWTIFDEKLKYGRHYHVAIPVSSDFRCSK